MTKLYHKGLKRVIEVPEGSVPVLEKSGWSADVPKSAEDQQPSNMPGWSESEPEEEEGK